MTDATLFLDNWKLHRPLASNDLKKEGALAHWRSWALPMKYIQTNNDSYLNIMNFDVDIDNAVVDIKTKAWDDGTFPEPYSITPNLGTGHAHCTILVKNGAVGYKQQKFFKDIQKKLTIKNGFDTRYKNNLMRNPVSNPATEYLSDHLYSLEELAEMVVGVRLPDRIPAREIITTGEGRNHNTFLSLMAHGGSMWYRYRDNRFAWDMELIERAYEINMTHHSPLDGRELERIIDSVSKYIWTQNSEETFRFIQKCRSKKGLLVRQEKAERKYEAVEIEVLLSGDTLKTVCERLGVNYGSYRVARKEYRERFGFITA